MSTLSLRGRPGGFTSGTARTGPAERAKRVYAYRRILRLLVLRDLKVRYAGSALGYLWSVLDPLLMSLMYWYVFTQIFHRGNIGYQPYIVFLLTGQLPWYWFSNGVSLSARALRSEAQMVRSSNVPRELWVIRSVASRGVEYLFSLPVLALFALVYLTRPHIEIVLMPLAMLMQAMLLTGIGLILAPLTVLVRDLERVIRVALRVALYASPVLYSVHHIPAGLRGVFAVNPMAGVLVLYRSAFFPQELDWVYVLHSAIGCVVVLAIGLVVFARLERPVLKEI